MAGDAPNPAPYEAVQSAPRLSVEQCHAPYLHASVRSRWSTDFATTIFPRTGGFGGTRICFAVGQFRSLRPRAKRTARRSGCW